MSVIPVSCLSSSDLARLGNNVRDGNRRSTISNQRRSERRQMSAVNRSLAGIGERIAELNTTVAGRR